MPTVYAGRWAKTWSWDDPLYKLSYYIVEQNRLGLRRLIPWRTHALSFCRKRKSVSIQWLGLPNLNHILLHYVSITCCNTLVGNILSLFTLLKSSLFYYIAKLYPTFLHCCGMSNLNTLLRYALSNSIAEQLPNSKNCRAIPNHKTLFRYAKHYYIAELYPISVHCRTMVDLNILMSTFAKRCRQPIRIGYFVTQ